jgi:adenylate cyclase
MGSPVSEATDRCGSCGNDLRAKARFCDVCGSPVFRRSALGEHKQVTVLFADVIGSMKLAAALDAERLQEIMNELFNRAAAVVQRYRGTVDKFTGDGLMALFGAPVALEDHALRACISALEIQSVTKKFAAEVLRRDGLDLQIRVGLNSGEVIAGEIGSGPGSYTAVGHPVGMAQRMEGAAPPGEVLCSLSTARLVEDTTRLAPVENVAVKGADGPVSARRLLAVESERMVVARNEGLMLGRDAELSCLRNVFDADRGCLVGIIGDPGLGKSRLIREFTAIAADRDAEIVVARCEAHTTTLAFGALSRLLRAMFKVEGFSDAEAREHTAAQCEGLLTSHSTDAQILFEAMGIADTNGDPMQVSVDGRRRRLVGVMAQAVLMRSARTVFVLEDVHWIDAPSDDVLADFSATLNVTTSIFVTTYRPEFHGALHHCSGRTVVLAPLNDAMTVRLVSQLLGADRSLARLAEGIAVAAVGNPFFVEEIVRDLAGRGVLSGSRGSYRMVGDADEIAVPATVQAVLAARIDRLPAETKSILNAAAVIGTDFDVDTLHDLLPEAESARLADLVATELIDQTEFVPRQCYCFHHPLVRTVAYESQLTATRAQAHRRLAAAIEARNSYAADEGAGLIATHLEAAGELDEAYRWHMRAADWLRARDLAAARARWESARCIADRLPADHDGVIAMRIAPRTMLISTTLYVAIDADADEHYREFRDLTMQTGDLKSLAIATAGRVMSLAVNGNRIREAATLTSELEGMVESIDCDAASKAIMLNAVAFTRFTNCQFDSALQAIDEILALSHDVPIGELAPAQALRGVIEVCLGESQQGNRNMREGTALVRDLPPVNSAPILAFWGILAAIGLCQPDDLVDDMRAVLRRAESYGDVFGILAAEWAYATALLRADSALRGAAIDMLEHAHASIQRDRVFTIFLAASGADLAIDAARNGKQDEAIDELRALVSLHLGSGSLFMVGCPAEALVELLIDRASIDDLTEAHRIVGQWPSRRPGIPALDLWWLKSRALLAKAERNSDGYAELANQYLSLCEKLAALGRLAQARRMVNEIA